MRRELWRISIPSDFFMQPVVMIMVAWQNAFLHDFRKSQYFGRLKLLMETSQWVMKWFRHWVLIARLNAFRWKFWMWPKALRHMERFPFWRYLVGIAAVWLLKERGRIRKILNNWIQRPNVKFWNWLIP